MKGYDYMIYYSDITFDKGDAKYRIEKLVALITKKACDKYQNILNSESDDISSINRAVKFLVTNLLPNTRWSNETDAINYSSTSSLVAWFISFPMRMLIDQATNEGRSIMDIVNYYEKLKFEDPDSFNRDIIVKFTGTQKFVSSIKYSKFIPGKTYSNYVHFRDDVIMTNDAIKCIANRFCNCIRIFSEFLIKPPDNDDSNPENWVNLKFDYRRACSYVADFAYPDPYSHIAEYQFYFSCRKSVAEDKERSMYYLWALQLTMSYCIEKLPGRLKYTPANSRYKNHALRKAIVDCMCVNGIAFNMKKNTRARQAISETLNNYYDSHPLPIDLDYDDYVRLVSMILDDYDTYCELILAKWNSISKLVYDMSNTNFKFSYTDNDVKSVKDFIFLLSLLDIVTRCQYDLMTKFNSDKSLLYAISPSFTSKTNSELDTFFNSSDGLYDLNEYPNLRNLVFKEINKALSSMLDRNSMRRMSVQFRNFRYQILKRKWITTKINVNNPSPDDIDYIKECAIKIALYMIRFFGGYIEKASIIYHANSAQKALVAPMFGRRLTD